MPFSRRTLLLLAAAKHDAKTVTDIDQLNGFAVEYNAYIASLQQGVLDTKRWKKVVAAWQRMTS